MKPTAKKGDIKKASSKPVAREKKGVSSDVKPLTKSKQAVANDKKVPAKSKQAVSDDKKPVSNRTQAGSKEKKTVAKNNQTGSRNKKSSKTTTVELVSKPVAQEIMNRLCKTYPDADCELDFENSFQLLISVILSAQTTDVQVNKVTPSLFKRFPTAKALAEGSLDDIKELIKPTGFFNAKATNIQRCAQALVERFKGEVPKTLEELTTLPGAGRKTANVVLGVAFGVPGWTVDTHVQRLTARLGFSQNTDPYKIELDLQKTFPDGDWSEYSITLIWHGRRLCYARNPDCAQCPVNDLCPSSQV